MRVTFPRVSTWPVCTMAEPLACYGHLDTQTREYVEAASICLCSSNYSLETAKPIPSLATSPPSLGSVDNPGLRCSHTSIITIWDAELLVML